MATWSKRPRPRPLLAGAGAGAGQRRPRQHCKSARAARPLLEAAAACPAPACRAAGPADACGGGIPHRPAPRGGCCGAARDGCSQVLPARPQPRAAALPAPPCTSGPRWEQGRAPRHGSARPCPDRAAQRRGRRSHAPLLGSAPSPAPSCADRGAASQSPAAPGLLFDSWQVLSSCVNQILKLPGLWPESELWSQPAALLCQKAETPYACLEWEPFLKIGNIETYQIYFSLPLLQPG